MALTQDNRRMNGRNLDPEALRVIEAKREQRRLKKLQTKPDAADDNGIPSVTPQGFKTSFIQRRLAVLGGNLPNRKISPSRFTIMTYNILAQSLVRRKLFPTSGESLKWKNRQWVLKAELQHYHPDVLCLQEVGKDMLDPCLHEFFSSAGYQYQYHTGYKKAHGVLIAWKSALFELFQASPLNYEELPSNELGDQDKTMRTNNVALICVLRSSASRDLITIATTHLFWHPLGSCHRAHQIGQLMDATAGVDKDFGQGNVLIAGDFNTTPDDPAYEALTQRPFTISAKSAQIMIDSSRHNNFGDEEDAEDEFVVNHDDTNGLSTEQPTPTIHDEATGPLDWQSLLHKLASGPQLYSMYGRHYSSVSDGARADHGEPKYTNWANVYRGTLDYIFTTDSGSKLRCSGLLELPNYDLLSLGQPQEGQFPSDHFCLMSEIHLGHDDLATVDHEH